MQSVVLYTRVGCHLCEDAHDLLVRLGIRPTIIDIDADPELRAQFQVWVPVIEIDGKVRFRGLVNELLLTRELRSADPAHPAQLPDVIANDPESDRGR